MSKQKKRVVQQTRYCAVLKLSNLWPFFRKAYNFLTTLHLNRNPDLWLKRTQADRWKSSLVCHSLYLFNLKIFKYTFYGTMVISFFFCFLLAPLKCFVPDALDIRHQTLSFPPFVMIFLVMFFRISESACWFSS